MVPENKNPSPKTSGGRNAVLPVFFAYGLLSIAATWPLVLHFSTSVIGGGGDDQVFLRNYWWVKHAIADLKTNPFYTDYLFYPHRNSLAIHALIFLNGLFSIPLQYLLPLPAVYNVFTLLAFALSGLGVFLLAGRFVNDRRAAFMAGLIFAASRGEWQPQNLLMTQWVPFYLYFLLKTLDEKKDWMKNSLVAGLFLAFNFYSDYYPFLASLIFTVISLAYYLLKKIRKPGELAIRCLPLLLIALPLVLPVTLMVLKTGVSPRGLQKLSPEVMGITKNVADAAGFFSPPGSNPVLGRLSFNRFFTGQENYSYLGLIAVFFSLYSLFKCRRAAHYALWAVSSLAFLLLSMGPYPHFLGNTLPVAFPYRLFMFSSFLVHFRAPARLFVYAVLGLSLLAACGMERAFKNKRGLLLPVLIPLVMLEYSAAPLAIRNCAIPPFYKILAADRLAGTVLEVPPFEQDGISAYGTIRDYVVYCQTLHGKKLMEGYLSRVPEPVLWSYLNLPVYRGLFLKEPALSQAWQSDKEAVPYFLDLFGVDYVIVHRYLPGRNAPDKDAGAIERYLKEFFPMDLIYNSPRVAVYKTRRAPINEISAQAATPLSILYLYHGWINGLSEGKTRFAISEGKESTLIFSLKPSAGYELDLDMAAIGAISDKRVRVTVNGKPLAGLTLSNSLNTYKVDIPSGLAMQGINRISFVPAETTGWTLNGGKLWPGFAIPVPSHLPGYWEQDNSKFGDVRTSFALFGFTLKEISPEGSRPATIPRAAGN